MNYSKGIHIEMASTRLKSLSFAASNWMLLLSMIARLIASFVKRLYLCFMDIHKCKSLTVKGNKVMPRLSIHETELRCSVKRANLSGFFFKAKRTSLAWIPRFFVASKIISLCNVSEATTVDAYPKMSPSTIFLIRDMQKFEYFSKLVK